MKRTRILVAVLDGIMDDLEEHPGHGGLRVFVGLMLCSLAGLIDRE